MLPLLRASYWCECQYWAHDRTLASSGAPRSLIQLLPKALGTQTNWSTKWNFFCHHFSMRIRPSAGVSWSQPRQSWFVCFHCSAASQGYFFYADEEIKFPAETNWRLLRFLSGTRRIQRRTPQNWPSWSRPHLETPSGPDGGPTTWDFCTRPDQRTWTVEITQTLPCPVKLLLLLLLHDNTNETEKKSLQEVSLKTSLLL